MELRVWVDGTQRVVCGVKLTTTCQEIVFALAHATQQAGRFTMIERWRNNERLLSPNEQPLVTLQRWGDHMNEVEFILRKTSTDPQPTANSVPMNQLQQQQMKPRTIQHQQQRVITTRSNHDNESTQQIQPSNSVGRRESPINPLISTPNGQGLNDHQQSFDNMYPHHQYNLTRRPQTVLGPITGQNNSLNTNTNYLSQAQIHPLARLPNSFRSSLSTSTLPSATNTMTASPSMSGSMMRPLYSDDQLINPSTSTLMSTNSHNGYKMHSENSQTSTNQARADQTQIPKNFPYEDLYSTANKKRSNQPPPMVPAKPRVTPITQLTNFPVQHQQPIQTLNATHMNYYHPNQSQQNLYASNIRPRHPPGYLDYLEAMANRNSLPILSNPNYPTTSQSLASGSNMFQRPLDHQQVYQLHQNGSSPMNSMTPSNRYRYSTNGPLTRTNYDQSFELGNNSMNHLHSNLDSSGHSSRVASLDVKMSTSGQSMNSHNSSAVSDQVGNISQASSDMTHSSVSQIGLDMLKVIEEQKKVLINQRSELDKLDKDQEFLETRQNTEQAELVNRIESEIRQLEDLWRENQAQIQKLENQDFEHEIQELKSEQIKMESEIVKQKDRLSKFEVEINECKEKIEQLEAELADQDSDSDDSVSLMGPEKGDNDKPVGENNDNTQLGANNALNTDGFHAAHLDLLSNGTHDQSSSKESKSSEDDYEDDSGGDASDDLSTKVSDSNSKIRSAKDVAYVDKRGLISGIRSLKLDKSRSVNRQVDSLRTAESATCIPASDSPHSKDKSIINNNSVENRCLETNGQHKEKTANNNNKYDFLVTL